MSILTQSAFPNGGKPGQTMLQFTMILYAAALTGAGNQLDAKVVKQMATAFLLGMEKELPSD